MTLDRDYVALLMRDNHYGGTAVKYGRKQGSNPDSYLSPNK